MLKRFFALLTIIIMTTSTVYASVRVSAGPHWEKSPITVYIPDDDYARSMKNAFKKWESKSYGKIDFKYVDKGPADIDVVFSDGVKSGDTPIASYRINSSGNVITKAEINIATKSNNIRRYSRDYIYTTMLHEVGHALGLTDDTTKKSGIMYMPIHEKQEIYKIDSMKLYKLYSWRWNNRRVQGK